MRGAAIYKLLTAAAENVSPPVNSVFGRKTVSRKYSARKDKKKRPIALVSNWPLFPDDVDGRNPAIY